MKRKQTGFGAIEFLGGIVIIGVITGIGFYVWQRGKDATKTEQTSSATQSTKAITPQEIIGLITQDYEGSYKLLNIDENNKPNKGEMSIRISDNSPAYKVEGNLFYNNSSNGSTIDIMAGPWQNDVNLPRKLDVSIRTKIINTFKNLGLKKTELYQYSEPDNGTYYEAYTGRGVVCTTQKPQSPTSATSASCGELAGYKTTAKTLKEFADALPNITPDTVLGKPFIKDSPVEGYKKANISKGSINGGGSAALFYQKTGNAWQYFSSAQMQLDCSAYNTQDLKNAFNGEECYSPDGTLLKVE